VVQGKPSTAEERENAVKFTQFLEENPYHEDAAEARKLVLRWLIQTPDIGVTLCGTLLPEVLAEKSDAIPAKRR